MSGPSSRAAARGLLALVLATAACSALEHGRARDPGEPGDVPAEGTLDGAGGEAGGPGDEAAYDPAPGPDHGAEPGSADGAPDCDDGNPCTADRAAGAGCVGEAVPDGAPCGDGLVCLESACVPACGAPPCARGLGLFDGCRCAVHPTGVGRDRCVMNGVAVPCTALPAGDPAAAQDGAADGRALLSRAQANGAPVDAFSGLEWWYRGAGTWDDASRSCPGPDWRLPTIEELAAWLDLGAGACPWWDVLVGRGCPAAEFRAWSSTPVPWDPAVHYSMRPTGPVADPAVQGLVACVRGAAGPAPDDRRFVPAGDDVLLDPQAGLAWARSLACDACTWADALASCAGRPGGWRLPTLKEALTAQRFEGPVPLADARLPVPPCAEPGCDSLWTGTPWFDSDGLGGVLVLRPATGTAGAEDPASLRGARCVRTAPGGRPRPAFETRANALAAGDQQTLAARTGLAALSDGGFVLSWESRDTSGGPSTVRVRRFDARGLPRDPVEVDPDPAGPGPRSRPVVAPLEGGAFVVAWDGGGPAGGTVRARAFGPDGRPAGPAVDLAAGPPGTRTRASLAPLPGGGFAAAWEAGCSTADGPGCVPPAGGGWGVQVRRFGAALAPEGDVLPLSQAGSGEQFVPALAPLEGGRVVAVWVDRTDGLERVFYRLLDPGTGDGTADLEIEPGRERFQPAWGWETPTVASFGRYFLVLWTDVQAPRYFRSVWGRRFWSADGSPESLVSFVNQPAADHQYHAVAAGWPDERWVVVQEQGCTLPAGLGCLPRDGSGLSIEAQPYSLFSLHDGTTLRVNARTRGDQFAPQVALLPDGQAVVAWTSDQEGTGRDVFFRRLEMDCHDGIDADGDGQPDCADSDCAGRFCE